MFPMLPWAPLAESYWMLPWRMSQAWIEGMQAWQSLAAGALVQAQVTPLPADALPEGARDGARISVRMQLPNAFGPGETVMIEAMVARAPSSTVPALAQEAAPRLPSKRR